MPRQFFVGGNFKMNGTKDSIASIVKNLNDASLDSSVEVVISPPSVYLISTRENLRKEVSVAAQNVYDQKEGAYTGEISVEHLRDTGATWVILGHSERRTLLNENDAFVASKAKNAVSNGINVILCCGETLEEREADKTIDVVTRQLAAAKEVLSSEDWKKVVIAYEPIWAIGTGKVATTAQAQDVHAKIRTWLRENVSTEVADETRILYGGSVSEKNCTELSKQIDIDGFLVGGASLKPAFVDIINCQKA